MLHMLVGLSNLFARHDDSVRFGIWPRSAVIDVVLFIGAIFFDTTMRGTAQGIEYGILVIFVLGYVVYAAFMFRYEYDGSRFCWFNGLFVRSVSVGEIREITMLSDKRRVAKIDFLLPDRTVRVRNDLPDVAAIVRKIASDHSIAVQNARLPWWSL